MRTRLPAALIAAFLCLMTYGSLAAPLRVLVVLSEPGGIHAATAEALRTEVERAHPGRVEWKVGPTADFTRGLPAPHWVVAVGTLAQRKVQAATAGEHRPPPLLAVLVPRSTFHRFADPVRVRGGQISAVFVDQPPARQLELARLALPSLSNLGILFGAGSRELEAEYAAAAQQKGLLLHYRTVEPGALATALQMVLPDVEALLAVPDPDVFNGQTVPHILAAAYRQRVPLIGFSPAYARAGALASLYSTPEQIGRRGGEFLSQALVSGVLPAPQSAREFQVTVNHDVAHSLGLALSEESLLRQLRQKEAR